MSNIIAVCFQGTVAQLSFWKGSLKKTYTVKLPATVYGKDLINEDCFKKSLFYLNTYLQTQEKMTTIEYIIGVPDSFGCKEKNQLLRYAKQYNVNVARVMSYSMAAALAIGFGDEKEKYFWVVIDNGKDIEIGSFESGYGVVEKQYTFLFKNCRWKDVSSSECYNPPADLIFNLTSPKEVFYIAIDNINNDFSGIMPDFLSKQQNIGMKYLSKDNIINGLGIQCGKLIGECSCGDILALDIFTPFQICLSINNQMYDLLKGDSIIPLKKDVHILNHKEDGFWKEKMQIQLLERRGIQYIPFNEIILEGKEVQFLLGMDYSIILDVDANSAANITVKNKEGELKTYPLQEYVIEGYNNSKSQSKKEEKKGTVFNKERFLEDLIPIFNNLFIGSSFSSFDDNPYIQGIANIYKQGKRILTDYGIELIDHTNVPFDLKYHNAVDHIIDLKLPPNTVTKINQIGFIVNGIVLKPASVVVAN